jgi:hypothetical protein
MLSHPSSRSVTGRDAHSRPWHRRRLRGGRAEFGCRFALVTAVFTARSLGLTFGAPRLSSTAGREPELAVDTGSGTWSRRGLWGASHNSYDSHFGGRVRVPRIVGIVRSSQGLHVKSRDVSASRPGGIRTRQCGVGHHAVCQRGATDAARKSWSHRRSSARAFRSLKRMAASLLVCCLERWPTRGIEPRSLPPRPVLTRLGGLDTSP